MYFLCFKTSFAKANPRHNSKLIKRQLNCRFEVLKELKKGWDVYEIFKIFGKC